MTAHTKAMANSRQQQWEQRRLRCYWCWTDGILQKQYTVYYSVLWK